jgi:hypothetical protein
LGHWHWRFAFHTLLGHLGWAQLQYTTYAFESRSITHRQDLDKFNTFDIQCLLITYTLSQRQGTVCVFLLPLYFNVSYPILSYSHPHFRSAPQSNPIQSTSRYIHEYARIAPVPALQDVWYRHLQVWPISRSLWNPTEKKKEEEKGNQRSKRNIVCVFRAEEKWCLHLPAHRRSWLGRHAQKKKRRSDSPKSWD